jgi:hypothetical protein
VRDLSKGAAHVGAGWVARRLPLGARLR